jgi:glycosyltransferase involved in cell wall biosynthesis
MISVCMATYNGEKYIENQLSSILVQLSEEDEIIISDDNSDDNTIKIIKNFNDKRIKIFINLNEKGYTNNFENALKKSSGDIIFLADQDDIWEINKVSIFLKYLNQYDFVVSDCRVVDENLNILHSSHFKLYNVKQGFLYNLLRPRYIGANMAFNRIVLNKCLPFPGKKKISAHDYWICLVAELYFQIFLIKEPLLLYRRHNSNASSGGEKSKNTLIHKLKVRIYAINNLIRIFFK